MPRTTAVAVLCLLAVAAGDPPAAGPKSAAAVSAIHKADGAVEAARKAYDAAVAKARRQEAAELNAAKRAATAKGDADEIVAIAAKVKEVEAEGDAAVGLYGRIASQQAYRYQLTDGVDKTIYLRPDGTIANGLEFERTWYTVNCGGAESLVIDGGHGPNKLAVKADGFAGQWDAKLHFTLMPAR